MPRRAPPPPVSEPGFTELSSLMAEVNNRHGDGVMQLSGTLMGGRHVDTGVFILDFALLGGVPDGFVTILFGYESSGKTTLAMRAAAGAQRKYPDKAVVYLDIEGTYDTVWAERHGVDPSKLFVAQPSAGEHAVDIAQGVLSTNEASVLIVDSMPALVPQKNADASAEDHNMATRATLLAKLCEKIIHFNNKAVAKRDRTSVILINQFRSKVGFVMGDPRVLPGGHQPRFLSSAMIELKCKETLGKNEKGVDIPLENEHGFVVKKSKLGNSIRSGSFKMVRDPGNPLGAGAISEAEVVVAYAKRMGFHSGAGQSQYLATLGDLKFGSGQKIADYLNANPEELHRTKQLLVGAQRKAMGLPILPPDGWLLGEVDDGVLALIQEA